MIIRHPTFEGLTREVPDEQARQWLDMGWVRAEPADAPTPDAPQTPTRKAAK